MARQLTYFKLANTIEHMATKGIPNDHHIGPDKHTSKITLTSWVNTIRSYIEDKFMDTIFYVYNVLIDFET